MSANPPMATVILVHGAWAECASWSEIIGPLESENLAVICAPIPLTSLTDDVKALHRVLQRTEGPLILVAHAYAGAVIGAAQNDRVKALVYIAALAPDENETVADVFYRDEPHPLAPKLAPDADGYIWMPSEGFENAFAPEASPAQLSILRATQRPIAIACIQEAAPAPAWKSTPTWFLIAEQDRMINPKTQHFMAGRMGATVRAHPVDHSPLITAPALVRDTILEAVHATIPPQRQ
jgi:pimeloyl-ACP methyl ester carboxylesterase